MKALTSKWKTKMKSLNTLLNKFSNESLGLRLGQYFCNFYIKESWSYLYYAEHENAIKIIEQWLKGNHYQEKLPQPIKR